jgi:uncharacterized glyoxalase superfamily protein PhnB
LGPALVPVGKVLKLARPETPSLGFIKFNHCMMNAVMRNRSVPCDAVLPHVMYRDLEAAIAWLTETLGFTEHYRYGEPASGAQVYLGSAYLMLKRAPPDAATPAQLGYGTQSLTIFVEDVAAHYHKAKAAGAGIVEELHTTCYGELQYGMADIEGHHWLFSQHSSDVSPEEWGATVAPR